MPGAEQRTVYSVCGPDQSVRHSEQKCTVNDYGVPWQPLKFLGMIIQLHKDQHGQVRLNSDFTGPFPIVNSVKQGCILAPTLFSIFFSMMLKHVIEDINDDGTVYIHYRLFNPGRVHIHTKLLSSCFVTFSLLTMLPSSTTPKEPYFAEAARLFRFEVNLKKTEVFQQPALLEEYCPPHITIGVTELKAVHQFSYLGCTITSDTKIDREGDNRLAKANSAFGRLYKRRRVILFSTLLKRRNKELHIFPKGHWSESERNSTTGVRTRLLWGRSPVLWALLHR